MLTINSEHPFSEDHFESKFQDNISSYNQSFKHLEEELTLLTKYYRDKIHSVFGKHLSEMKSMNEHIADILAKLMIDRTKIIKTAT